MNLESFNIIVSYLSEITEVIPFIFYLKFAFKKQPYNILGYYFILSASIKTYTLITAKMHINNMVAYHLLAFIEAALLYAFYAKIINNTHPRVWVIVILFLFTIINSLFIESIYQFNSIGWTFSIFFLLCLSLGYLYRLYDDLENIQLGSHPLFIINTGFMIYFAGSLFTYIFGWEILSKEARGFFHNAWIIQSFSNIGKNVIVSYGLWLARFR